MNYRIVFSLFMFMILSQNISCSHDTRRESIRFDNRHHNGDVEVHVINFVKSKKEMMRCFAAAQAQYIAENNIIDASALTSKKVVRNNITKKITRFLGTAYVEKKHYCLLLKHPAANAWKVAAFIERHN